MNQEQNELKAIANQYMKERNYLAAIQSIEQLLFMDPTDDEAMYMIAAAYLQLEDYKNAIKYAKLKISMNNDLYQMETYLILSYAYNGLLDYESAIDSLKKLFDLANRLATDHDKSQNHKFLGMAYQTLASYYVKVGNIAEARSAYLNASMTKTDFREIISNYSSYLLCLHYDASLPDTFIFQEHQNFQQYFQQVVPYQHTQINQEEKIKLGYISPDFRQHVMLYFYYQLLARYDKNKFQITCYSIGEEDLYTERLKSLVDCWRDVRALSYEQIAKIIYEDKIDILVDLAGHSVNSGLAVLAYKPAPIQVSGLGYFNTTGLYQVDYFLTDQYVDPIGQNDHLFTEKLIRLPHSHFCYTGRSDVAEFKEAPCMKNGFITFCSFNRIAKITDEMLTAWREILLKVNDARLVFKDRIFSSSSGSQNFAERLQRLHFPMERVEFRKANSMYMDEYLDMDIALDTYPYPGGGTTCEALYMGVPVVTLAGKRHGARFGYSILKNIGLDECISETLEEYVAKAVALARNKVKLDTLHKTLRNRMMDSPIMDGKKYIEDIENAYLKMLCEFKNNRREKGIEQMNDEVEKEIKVLNLYLKIKPKDKETLKRLANLYMMEKAYEKVVEITAKITRLDQADYEAFYLASAACLYLDDDEKAFKLAQKVTNLKPDFIGAYMALAFYYDKKLMLKENIDTLQKVLSLAEAKPAHGLNANEYELISQAWQQLAASKLLLGDISAAKEAYLKASEIKPTIIGKCEEYSGYLMCTNYDLALSEKEMLAQHKKFNNFFADVKQYQHPNIQPKEKLRIGYISPDFCYHAVVFYCYQLLHSYNKENFEVVCYHNGKADITTEQLKSFGTIWRDISGLSEAEAARMIYEDNIDILVELAGHTAHNCLPILAYKPAPIQMCGIGYFNTTGLDTVDYFLTDHYVDPIGKNDECFTEKLLRLPTTHWCYTNRLDEPDCQETAYMRNKYITFCSFNNFAKTTDQMLALWREILAQIPNSKLVFKNKIFASEYGCKQISHRLLKLGFKLSQIEFRPSNSKHMKEYLDMDIALDTYPYVGGATTCEALYMGVPVVTLVGNRHGSRFGYSMLKNIDLEECIAYTEEEYIEKAVALASDIDRLNDLHKGLLRKKMLASPLMDGKQYMLELEQVYQEIWNKLVNNKLKENPDKKMLLADALSNIYKNLNVEQSFALLAAYEAEKITEELIKLCITNDEKINLLNLIAVQFYEMGNFDNLIPLLTTALSIDENNEITLQNLGVILHNFGQEELALKYLNKMQC